MNRNTLNQLSKIIFFSALEVHRTMGPGLLESIYEYCLVKDLQNNNLNLNVRFVCPALQR